jgi:hypothetical protein
MTAQGLWAAGGALGRFPRAVGGYGCALQGVAALAWRCEGRGRDRAGCRGARRGPRGGGAREKGTSRGDEGVRDDGTGRRRREGSRGAQEVTQGRVTAALCYAGEAGGAALGETQRLRGTGVRGGGLGRREKGGSQGAENLSRRDEAAHRAGTRP